jgi:predicted Zn-dependent peptidase
MNKYIIFFSIFSINFLLAQKQQHYEKISQKDFNGFIYEYVTDDPTQLRIYTLNNGLKVYLSKNSDEPRIQTYIAVKAGSTYDPSDATGLAHYLEHMMFKGSDKISTTNFEKEEPLINDISDLYEEHFIETNVEKKKQIYHKIDSISNIASKFAIANEFDKLLLSIGAKDINATTSNERTIYYSNIPSNEVEKWLILEKERFSKLVLRLFHTELEAVYEEFNMSQDNEEERIYNSLYENLFKDHPYGTQTIIGKSEHLKSPSMKKIMDYWSKYYVPNNMAICLSGDFDCDKVILLINKYFGGLELKDLNLPIYHKLNHIEKPIVVNIYGPETEKVFIGFRSCGSNDNEKKYYQIINLLLNNNKSGIIDTDLLQSQKVLKAGSIFKPLINSGTEILYGEPNQNQDIESVKELLLKSIEKIKEGKFDDWLIKACINQMKILRINEFEKNGSRAFSFVKSFTEEYNWEDYLKVFNDLEKITKIDIINFANQHFKDNYVVVFKRKGIDNTVIKLDKPKISAIEVNKDLNSEFYKSFIKISVIPILPEFIDYEKSILKSKLKNNIELNYIKNQSNDLFKLYYIVDIGKKHNKYLDIALSYLTKLGTSSLSPPDLQKELFKLGLEFKVSVDDNRAIVSLTGIDESFDKGIEILENIINTSLPDTKIFNDFINSYLTSRENSKSDKDQIFWSGLLNYGQYGRVNPFTDILSSNEIKKIKPDDLTNLIKSILSYKHYIFYYGKRDLSGVSKLLTEKHKIPNDKLKDTPNGKIFETKKTDKNQVYFVNYDMVQTYILLMQRKEKFNSNVYIKSKVFNEYYGGGLSSIAFQEIRESKGLAYSVYAALFNAEKENENNYLLGFMATQPDKMQSAIEEMKKLFYKMPKSDNLFYSAKESVKKNIESERITKDKIFWKYLALKDLGVNYDIRKDIYHDIQDFSFKDLNDFFDDNIKSEKFTFLIMGNRNTINIDNLKSIGNVKELSVEEIFNY